MINPGDELGGFQIVEKLGEGGMGVVYLATEPRLGRRVALKLITPSLSADPEFSRRFEDEARSAASIEHPNAVPIYSAGDADGHLYLAMRFIDGTDLRAMLRTKGAVSPEIATRIIDEVAGALDSAHELGLVHRDVKPANILVEGSEPMRAAYLTDFGLTKGLEESRAGLTGTGQWVGTIDYVAPEQMHGSRIDARTDVYALGCVLYELLTGAIPFAGSDVQKMWAHTNDPVPPLDIEPPSVGSRLDPVIARATSKDPDERYPSAGDLGRAARAAVEGTSIGLSERSVATGAAAIGLQEGGAPPTRPAQAPSRSAPPEPPEPPTRALPVELEPETERRSKPHDGGGGSGGRTAAWIGAALVVAAGLVAGAIIISSGGGGGSQDKTVVQQQTKTEPDVPTKSASKETQGGNGAQQGGGNDSSGQPPVTPTENVPQLAQTFNGHCACSMKVPSQADWSGPIFEDPNDAIFRTIYDGPSGQGLLVDWTPDDEPLFGGGADSTQTLTTPNFGAATEYTAAPGQIALPLCATESCTEIIIHASPTSGWAVVAGGYTNPAVSQSLARQAALSLEFAGE